MNTDERQLIQGLFSRLGEAERTAAPRDAEAESMIREHVARQPAAPYYLAQTVIVQEEALKAANARIQELERAAGERSQPAAGGGFLGNLFGGGGSREAQRPMGVPAGYDKSARGRADPVRRSDRDDPASGPWGSARPAMPMEGRSRGGGFLAGAAQTAVGVAGGVMLGSMLGNLFDGSGHSFLGDDSAQTGTGDANGANAGAEDTGFDEGGHGAADVENTDFQDMGDDLGGDFDEI